MIKLKNLLNQILNENTFMSETMTYDELLKLTTNDRKEKASNVNVRSLPITIDKNRERWNFRYKSSPAETVTDLPFKGNIVFLKGEVESNADATKLECKVDCSCKDFMYRFAYNDAAKGASQVGPDSLNGAINRRPKPAYDYGEGLCKHLTALGRFLKTKIQATKKSNLFEAIDDVVNQGPFNVTYYD